MKLTPTQLDVLRKMADGAELVWSNSLRGETSLCGNLVLGLLPLVRTDTRIALLRAGAIAISRDEGVRVRYRITKAGRAAVKAIDDANRKWKFAAKCIGPKIQ